MRFDDFQQNSIINEIRMNPRAFDKFIKSEAANGILCGFEAELYYRGVVSEDESSEDYEDDRPVRTIDGVCNFFDDDNYNSDRAISRLRSKLEEDYFAILQTKIEEEWIEEREELIKNYMEENSWDWEDAITTKLEEMGLSRSEISAAFFAKNSLKKEKDEELNKNNNDQLEMFKADEDYANYEKARALAEEELESDVQHSIRRRDHTYLIVYEEFSDETKDSFDEQDYMHSKGIFYMSDILAKYDFITWTIWTTPSESDSSTGFDSEVATELGKNLKEYIPSIFIDGRSHNTVVKVADTYKGIARNYDQYPNLWIIEPDSSLDERENTDDMGAEIISPPIPLSQIESVMRDFWKFAKSNRAYSHESTGFHVNVSLPNITTGLQQIDYLKLALLLGDEYVGREFDRFEGQAAHFCQSSLARIKKSYQLMDIPDIMIKLKTDLENSAAQAVLRQRYGSEKYSSIHLKHSYIEFRSVGGENYFNSPSSVLDTAKRFAYATYIASQPQLERNEYAKKLTSLLSNIVVGRGPTFKYYDPKLPANLKQPTVFVDRPQRGFRQLTISPEYDKDIINIFARYAVGELPQAALKSFIKQAQLTRTIQKQSSVDENKYYWWKVESGSKKHAIEVVATNKNDALKIAAGQWGVTMSHEMMLYATATPIRPYEEPQKSPASRPSGYHRSIMPAEDPEGNFEIYNRITNESMYRFNADNTSDAWEVHQAWISRQALSSDAVSRFGVRPVLRADSENT